MTPSSFPDDELRRALRRLIRLASLLEPHEHSGMKLSLSEVMAMGELSEVEAMSQHELGRLLGLEKSTVSRLAAALERRGWIVRQREPANRRVYRLQLTDDGREVAGRLGEDLRAHHQQLLGALTPTERAALTVGLTGLVRVIESHHQQSPSSRPDG
ncbi:MAG TPA: MarR family transcriptional regulator [Propionibacteriaceae bacterium]|nr:MarR family transcriptional regulator [Propionibacteriaceae bacterium]